MALREVDARAALFRTAAGRAAANEARTVDLAAQLAAMQASVCSVQFGVDNDRGELRNVRARIERASANVNMLDDSWWCGAVALRGRIRGVVRIASPRTSV